MNLADWRALVRSHLPPMDLAREPEIVEELAQHLADLHAEALAAGRTREDALALARAALPEQRDRLARDLATASRSLPGIIADKWAAAAIEPSPPSRRMTFMGDFRRDVLYATRILLRAPGFAAIAILTLALGIGAQSAIFGAVDAILLRPLPYPHADRLVVPVSVNAARGIDRASITFADYMDWRRETTVFADVALFSRGDVDLTGDGDPERAQVAQVTPEFFRLVDATLLAGRAFVEADHAASGPRVTVIAFGLWQRRFGGAPDVVGRTIRIGGVPVEIVGVLPARSVWPTDVALFLPLRPARLNQDVRTRRDNMIFQAIARLRDGVAIEQGDAALSTIAVRLERDHPESRKGWTNRLVPLRDYIVEDDLRRALVVLLAAVGSVLLIACANLSSLALVRGTGRAREWGVRFALGASRWRIVRQLLVESAVLAALGGGLGVALAAWMMNGLAAMAPEGTPFIDEIGLDWRVVAAAAALSLTALVLAGLLPAVASSAVQLGSALKDGTPGAGSSRQTARLRQILIVGEIAGAVVLLAAAALLIRSFGRVTRIDPGVDVDRVLTGRLVLPGQRYPTAARSAEFFQRLTERLAAVPGVEAAAATSFVPVGGGGFGLGRVFLAEGWPEPPAGPDVSAQWNVVTPDYFRAVGIPLLRGRAFDARDRADATPVVIVSESFAAQMFGDADPIGKRMRSWRDENVLREVVGVVTDVRYAGLTDRERKLVYVPHTQDSWGLMNVAMRAAAGPPEALTSVLRREIAALDPDLALSNVQTLAGHASASIARERYTALLVSLLSAAALALAAIGVYGVLTYAVSLRRHELGVRVALGASEQHLYLLVLRQGLALALAGIAIGLAGALTVSRLLSKLLFDTEPTDPAAYIATITAILVATGAACLFPARRAAKADPLAALRVQ